MRRRVASRTGNLSCQQVDEVAFKFTVSPWAISVSVVCLAWGHEGGMDHTHEPLHNHLQFHCGNKQGLEVIQPRAQFNEHVVSISIPNWLHGAQSFLRT
jgi:hypothetical protein